MHRRSLQICGVNEGLDRDGLVSMVGRDVLEYLRRDEWGSVLTGVVERQDMTLMK